MIFCSIVSLLHQLRVLACSYAIALIVVDGRKAADLAQKHPVTTKWTHKVCSSAHLLHTPPNPLSHPHPSQPSTPLSAIHAPLSHPQPLSAIHNPSQPSTTPLSHPQPLSAIHNPSQPSTTPLSHPQPLSAIHNPSQPSTPLSAIHAPLSHPRPSQPSTTPLSHPRPSQPSTPLSAIHAPLSHPRPFLSSHRSCCSAWSIQVMLRYC